MLKIRVTFEKLGVNDRLINVLVILTIKKFISVFSDPPPHSKIEKNFND